MKGYIVVSFAAAIACLLVAGCVDLSEIEQKRLQREEQNKLRAEENFSQHLAEDPDALLLGCSSRDSDHDGYVTCDTKNQKTGQYQSFECNYEEGESGCRVAKTTVIREEEAD